MTEQATRPSVPGKPPREGDDAPELREQRASARVLNSVRSPAHRLWVASMAQAIESDRDIAALASVRAKGCINCWTRQSHARSRRGQGPHPSCE